jgi:hypothetical protein
MYAIPSGNLEMWLSEMESGIDGTYMMQAAQTPHLTEKTVLGRSEETEIALS